MVWCTILNKECSYIIKEEYKDIDCGGECTKGYDCDYIFYDEYDYSGDCE